MARGRVLAVRVAVFGLVVLCLSHQVSAESSLPATADVDANGLASIRPEQSAVPADVDPNNPLFVRRPVPLLVNDTTGTRLLVQDEGLAWLSALGDTPLCILVTAGPARSGKSFLHNNIVGADHASGFGVGHGVQGFTRGVWFWGQPKFVDLDGQRVAVVHMDTEGFGALGNVAGYDPKLCLFSVLFASSFYYNLRGLIDMNNIKFLSTVAMFDDVFRSKFGIEFPLAAPFWVVQNFESDLSSIDPPTAEGYLDLAMREKEEPPAANGDVNNEVVRYNRIIAMIKRKFPEQPRPRIMLMDDPKEFVKRKDMTKYRFEDYDEGYRKQVLELRRIMSDRIAVKKFQNLTITGSTMAELTMRLVPAMNKLDNDAPGIIRSIAAVVARQCFAHYVEDVERVHLPAPLTELEEAHESAATEALTAYDEQCVGSSELDENTGAKELLSQNITMTHSERQSSNKLAGMRHCELLYDKLLARLQVYVDALDSDGDSPVKPMDDEMADALSELQANCHMPPKDVDAKVASFTTTASMMCRFVAEKAAARAVETGTRLAVTITLSLFFLKLLAWVLSFAGLCPERVLTFISALATLSLVPMMFFVLFQLGLLERVLPQLGLEVDRAQLQEWLVGAQRVVGRAGYYAHCLLARRRRAHHVFIEILDEIVVVLSRKIGPGSQPRIQFAMRALGFIVAGVTLVGMAMKRTRKVAFVVVIACLVGPAFIVGGDTCL